MRQILWQTRDTPCIYEVYALASFQIRELVAPVPFVSDLA